MLSIIVYVVAAAFGTIILSCIALALRPPQKMEEVKSWKIILGCAVLAYSAPYMYVEVLTRTVGKDMASAVTKAYGSSPFTGDMRYYKVLSCNGKVAHVLAVGSDHNNWGGKDAPVVSVNLIKNDKGEWKADSFRVMASDKLNQDSLVLPPYF